MNTHCYNQLERVEGERTEKMEANIRKRIEFLPRNESVFTLKGY